jgi:hypothetical protein
MPFEDLFLAVQRKMVGELPYDHLRKQTRARRALLDRLWRLGRSPHRTGTGVLFTNIFGHGQLCRNVFVALA